MANAENNVCSQSWGGKHGEKVTLKNENTKIVSVSPAPNLPWPFSDPTSGFSIPAKSGNTPGTYVVTLKDTKGDYGYSTTNCPGDPKDVNPKTVIIT